MTKSLQCYEILTKYRRFLLYSNLQKTITYPIYNSIQTRHKSVLECYSKYLSGSAFFNNLAVQNLGYGICT